MSHPHRFGILAVAAGLAGLAVVAAPAAEAQRRVPDPWVWAAPWGADATAGVAQERQRLPIYDDAGIEIPFADVEARVDPSGVAGAFWGTVALGIAGIAVGGLLASSDCDERVGNVQYFCSPRQEAMRDTLPWALGLAFGGVGGWIGWSVDRTTWHEALRDVRALRRRAGS